MPFVPAGMLFAILGTILVSPMLPVVFFLHLCSGPLRRSRGMRNFLFLLVGMEVGFAPLLWGYVDGLRDERARARQVEDQTVHLDAPRVIDGIAFPAGSKVYVMPDGMVWYGTVPEATVIKGLPLIGDFRLGPNNGDDPPGGIALATLAGATEVRGVPCAAGPFTLQQGGLRCTLAQDYDYLGHALKHGEAFEVGRLTRNDTIVLRVGTLAGPEPIDDATWPAGAVVGGIDEPADRLRHNPDVVGYPVRICLGPGATVAVEGAVLHGPIVYAFSHNIRRTEPSCWPLATSSRGPPSYTGGYIQVGDQQFSEGVWSSEKGWLKVR